MTTNHPAHGPVSLERLHQIREHLLHDTQYSNGGNRAYILADMLRVIEGAIAAFDAEPVAEWTNEECLEFLSIAFRHAEIKGDLELDDIRLGVKMVNDGQAAMLRAGNSPVTPDGYVLVPIKPTENMIINGFESEPDEFFSKSEEWDAYQEMSGCEQAAHRAKLCWAAMIASAPKPKA